MFDIVNKSGTKLDDFDFLVLTYSKHKSKSHLDEKN